MFEPAAMAREARATSVGQVLFIWLLYAAAVCGQEASAPAAAAPKGAQKRALLVGVNDYAEISDLKYCRRDIEILRERLVAAGFPEANVTVLYDGAKQTLYQPFRTSIEHHLQVMLRAAGPEDLVLFAFSGHGVEADGASYLCPIEAQLDAPQTTLLALENVYQALLDSPARQRILLIDACRNDPRPKGERSVEGASSELAGFARSLENPPQGIMVLTSCQPGQLSVEDDKMGHGVFLHFVLEGLRGEADREQGNGDGQVSLFELYRYTDTRTRAYVARTRDLVQTPVLRGELTGDFPLGQVVSRAREVHDAWTTVREQADALAEQSEILRWLKQMYTRQIAGAGNRSQTASFERMINTVLRRPEALVLSNPSIITAEHPEALFALQRAYAFGVRGDLDGMLAASDEALRLEPDNPFAYLLHGMVYVERAARIASVDSLIGSNRDVRTLASVIETMDRYPQLRRRVQDVFRELRRVAPDAALDLDTARRNPAALARAVEDALAKLDEEPLTAKALDDFKRIGLGIPCMLEQGTALKSGEQTIARAEGYTDLFEITDRKDDWLFVERELNGQKQRGWVPRKSVSQLIPFMEQFQLVLEQQ